MALELTVVDAFTDRPFSGNQAAVAVVDAFPADATMQSAAAEMALAETTFCVPRPDGDHDVRWFTPTVEVPLCGHATLAAAHVLGGRHRFHTLSGVLSGWTEDDGKVWLDFPADAPAEAPVPTSLPIDGVLGYARTRTNVLLELATAAEVRAYEPDLAALSKLSDGGVIVTAPGDEAGVACVSRFFAPNMGIPEDSATGSAHCSLAEWWGERLGTHELVGEQASPRGAVIFMARRGDRVHLGGFAVTVSKVSMLVPLA